MCSALMFRAAAHSGYSRSAAQRVCGEHVRRDEPLGNARNYAADV